MSIEADFKQAADDVQKLKAKPSDTDLLEIYALFKQGSIGDINTDKPGLLDFKGKAKWEAWKGKQGMSSEDAKKKYVEKVKSLIATIGLQ